MSSFSHDGYGGAGSDPLAGMVVSLVIVALTVLVILVLIGLYLLFRCVVLIVRVFYKDPKNRALWRSLGLCLLLCLVGGSLTAFLANTGFLVLAGLGCLQFLITCKVVEIDNTPLFLREENHLSDKMLHTSWWADYNA